MRRRLAYSARRKKPLSVRWYGCPEMRGIWALFATAALLLGAGTPSAGAVSLDITGPEQVVFDWDTMHCFQSDGPDGTTRAFRDSLGREQLTHNGAKNRMIWTDKDNHTHD